MNEIRRFLCIETSNFLFSQPFYLLGANFSPHLTPYILSLNAGSLKIEDKYTYLGSRFSSTENDINVQQAKAWMAINTLSIIWKSNSPIK